MRQGLYRQGGGSLTPSLAAEPAAAAPAPVPHPRPALQLAVSSVVRTRSAPGPGWKQDQCSDASSEESRALGRQSLRGPRSSLANSISPHRRSRCNRVASAAAAHRRAPRLPGWGHPSPSRVTLVMRFTAPRLSTAEGRDLPPRAVPDPRTRAGKALQMEETPTEQCRPPAAGRVPHSVKFSQVLGSAENPPEPHAYRVFWTPGLESWTNSRSYPQSSSHTSSRRKSPSRAWLDHHSRVPPASSSYTCRRGSHLHRRLVSLKPAALRAAAMPTRVSRGCSPRRHVILPGDVTRRTFLPLVLPCPSTAQGTLETSRCHPKAPDLSELPQLPEVGTRQLPSIRGASPAPPLQMCPSCCGSSAPQGLSVVGRTARHHQR